MFKANVKNRLLVDKIMMGVVIACAIVAITPLMWILGTLFYGGAAALSWEFLTEEPGAVGSGVPPAIGPAIQGTLIIIGLSAMIGVPIGVMSGIYLSEYGGNWLARQVRFFTDVFMEFPSIVLGVFAFLAIVLLLGHFSVWAGAFALSLIMFPIVARATEESLKMVPYSVREAGTALGLRKWIVTLRIIIPAAKKAILTGILLSVSRISGETAPLIMTILGSSQFFSGFDSPMDALPLRIWRFSLQPYDEARLSGWGAALVIVLIILAVHVAVRYWFSRKNTGKGLIARMMERRSE
jgi:phosphate transport system permease protein